MSRILPFVAVLALTATACAGRAPATPDPVAPKPVRVPIGTPHIVRIEPRTDDRSGGGTIEFRSPRLALAYAWALARSPRFRTAMGDYAAGPRFGLRVGYADTFGDRYARFVDGHGGAAIFAAAGEIQPRDGTSADAADIVFFTENAEYGALRAGMLFEQLIEQLALILIHELYGHALPLAERGVWPLPCDDPPFSSPVWVLGCAAERENEIRADMGVPQRRRYAGATDLPFLCLGDASFCPRRPVADRTEPTGSP